MWKEPEDARRAVRLQCMPDSCKGWREDRKGEVLDYREILRKFQQGWPGILEPKSVVGGAPILQKWTCLGIPALLSHLLAVACGMHDLGRNWGIDFRI